MTHILFHNRKLLGSCDESKDCYRRQCCRGRCTSEFECDTDDNGFPWTIFFVSLVGLFILVYICYCVKKKFKKRVARPASTPVCFDSERNVVLPPEIVRERCGTLSGFSSFHPPEHRVVPEHPISPPENFVDPLEHSTEPQEHPVDPPEYTVDPPEHPADLQEQPVSPPEHPVDPPEYSVDPPEYSVDPPGYSVNPPEYSVDPPGYPVDPPGYSVDSPGYSVDPS